MTALAFYTVGDNRTVPSVSGVVRLPWQLGVASSSITYEEMWRARAISLAGSNAHGVSTVQAAIGVLRSQPAGSLTHVYFIGHGFSAGGGGFFFSGTPVGTTSFTGNQYLGVPPPPAFMAALAYAIHTTQPVVLRFLSCYSGQNSFINVMLGALWTQGFRNIDVAGVQQYYNVRFQTSGGHITGWQDQELASSSGAGHASGNSPLQTGGGPSGTVGRMNHGVPPVTSPVTNDPLEGIQF